MIRVYLDWNVITRFKDKYADLFDYFDANKHFVMIPYSVAHFQDLMKSKIHNGKPNPYFEQDLEKMNEACSPLRLDFSEAFALESCTPKEFYNEYVENSIGGLGLPTKTEFIQLVKDASSDIDLQALLKSLPPEGHLTDLNGNLVEIRNMWESILYSLDLNDKFMNDPLVYKHIKEQSTLPESNKKHKKYMHAKPENAFQILNDILHSVGENNSWDSLLQSALGEDKWNEFTRFIAAYTLFDSTGYHPDKDRSLSNITTDATHAFYAAHCDVFITDDKRLIAKLKPLYLERESLCRVVRPADAIELIDSMKNYSFNSEYVNDLLADCEEEEVHGTDLPILQKKVELEYPLFGLFRYAYSIHRKDNGNTIMFFFDCCVHSRGYLAYWELGQLLNNLDGLYEADNTNVNIEDLKVASTEITLVWYTETQKIDLIFNPNMNNLTPQSPVLRLCYYAREAKKKDNWFSRLIAWLKF